MTILSYLQTRLKKTELTQMQIAQGSGVPQTTISRIERGGNPTMKNAEKILAFLDAHEKKPRKAGAAAGTGEINTAKA